MCHTIWPRSVPVRFFSTDFRLADTFMSGVGPLGVFSDTEECIVKCRFWSSESYIKYAFLTDNRLRLESLDRTLW